MKHKLVRFNCGNYGILKVSWFSFSKQFMGVSHSPNYQYWILPANVHSYAKFDSKEKARDFLMKHTIEYTEVNW